MNLEEYKKVANTGKDVNDKSRTPFDVQVNGSLKCVLDGCGETFFNLDDASTHVKNHLNATPQSSSVSPPAVSDIDVLKSNYQVREELSKSSPTVSIRDVLKRSAEEKLMVYVPSLDSNVEFKPMSVADYLQYKDVKDPSEQNVEFVWRSLRGVDPSLTKAEVEKLGYHVVADIATAIDSKIGFLQIGRLLEQSRKMFSP